MVALPLAQRANQPDPVQEVIDKGTGLQQWVLYKYKAKKR